MTKLRLGPILDDKPVRRTVHLTAALDAELSAYAEAYASEFGQQLAVEKLIPPMVERFIRADRGFATIKRAQTSAPPRRPAPTPPAKPST
jgi:hypothetical protein